MTLLEKILYLKYALFLRFYLSAYFEPLLGWECAYVCYDLRNEKKAFTVNRENIKQTIAVQVTFILKKKLSNYIFYQNLAIFSATYVSNLNPCYDGNVHPYATTQKLKKKGSALKGRNIKEATGIQVTFMLEIEIQKYIFSKFSALL